MSCLKQEEGLSGGDEYKKTGSCFCHHLVTPSANIRPRPAAQLGTRRTKQASRRARTCPVRQCLGGEKEGQQIGLQSRAETCWAWTPSTPAHSWTPAASSCSSPSRPAAFGQSETSWFVGEGHLSAQVPAAAAAACPPHWPPAGVCVYVCSLRVQWWRRHAVWRVNAHREERESTHLLKFSLALPLPHRDLEARHQAWGNLQPRRERAIVRDATKGGRGAASRAGLGRSYRSLTQAPPAPLLRNLTLPPASLAPGCPRCCCCWMLLTSPRGALEESRQQEGCQAR